MRLETQLAEQLEIKGLLPIAIEEAHRFIERHIASGVVIRELRSEPRWQIPQIAVREALVNAVVHSDYHNAVHLFESQYSTIELK